MPDLSDDLRQYFDELASRVDRIVPSPSAVDGHLPHSAIADVEDNELDPHQPPRPRRVRWLGVAAALLLIGGVVAVVAVTRPDPDGRVITGTTTRPVAQDLGWLTPFGPEVTAPPTPDGWKVLDFEDFRFAVPEEWSVPASSTCVGEPSVLVRRIGVAADRTCDPTPNSAEWPYLRVVPTDPGRHDNTPVDTSVARVGTLRATRVDYVSCDGCPPGYRFDNGYEVTAYTPLADQVLATFSDSGARRTLQGGPIADTSGWRTITYEGVGLRVPDSWDVVDLPSHDDEQNQTNPGICGWSLFPSGDLHRAYLGVSQTVPSCPPDQDLNLSAGEGVWVRSVPDGWSDRSFTTVAQGAISGLEVTVIQVSTEQRQRPDPALDLLVRHGKETLWVSVGAGQDASTSRSILRSLHRASNPPEDTTSTTSTPTWEVEPDGTVRLGGGVAITDTYKSVWTASYGCAETSEPAVIVRVDAEDSTAAAVEVIIEGQTVAHLTEPSTTDGQVSVFYLYPSTFGVDWHGKDVTIKLTEPSGDGAHTGPLPETPSACP